MRAAAEREATWLALSRRAMALIDAKDARSKERTAALRAMGKLARAGIAIGSQASNDLDAMMERAARWTTAEASFARGGNDFDKRFEATDRHCALLGTYADLISLRPPGEPVQPSTLDLLIDIIRWVWEHYPFAGDRMRVSLHACLKTSSPLHERGGATLLADVHARLARPLLALSLRVAPPDPIDSALFDAQPVPLWPKYVGLWVDLLGGDGLAQPGAPSLADDAEGPRGKKKAPRDLVGEASSRLRRSRSRSIEMERGETERSSANRSSLDHSPMDVDAPSSDEASARAFVGASLAAYDAFVGEVLQLCQTLNLEVVPLRRGPGDGAAEEEAGSVDRDADADATTRALALELGEGVAAADPGDARTFLSLVDLTCAALAAAPSAFVTRWLAPLVEHLAAFASAHPLMSGFYKIARVALAAGEDGGVFAAARRGDADARETATACRAFLRDVAGGGARLSEELRASALRLTLAAPEGLLTTRCVLAAPLRDALRLGLHHAPLAEAALDALEAGSRAAAESTTGRDGRSASFGVVAALRPYVDRAPQEDGRELEADAASGVDPGAAGATGAGYRAAKRAAKRGRAADLEASREGLDARDGGLDAASRGSSARWEAPRTPSWAGREEGEDGRGWRTRGKRRQRSPRATAVRV